MGVGCFGAASLEMYRLPAIPRLEQKLDSWLRFCRTVQECVAVGQGAAVNYKEES